MSGAPSNKADKNPTVTLTLDMVRAGVAAYDRWDSVREPPQCMVTDVFYSMLAESPAQEKVASSAATIASKR